MELKFIEDEIKTPFIFKGSKPEDVEPEMKRLASSDVEHIAELFQTPLTGAYNWDYEVSNQKLWKLYELGKRLNWDAQVDIDWDTPKLTKDQVPVDDQMFMSPFFGYEPFEKLSEKEKMRLRWHQFSSAISNFVHGEQGALLVASQLVTCAPTEESKFYAASQTFDEARHVEVYRKYLEDRVGFMYPIDKHLKALLDKVLTDPRWDIKFVGMQLVIESLALAAFDLLCQFSHDPVLKQVTEYVMRDEGRHVGFGVNFLEEYYQSGLLSEQEMDDRAMFTYEAAYVMRERLLVSQAGVHCFGWPEEELKARMNTAEFMSVFRDMLFTRLMPNVKKIGLLRDNVKPLYDKLGVLELQDLPDATQFDWVALSKPFARSQREVA